MSSGQVEGRSTAAVSDLPADGADVSALAKTFPWFDGGKGEDPVESGTLDVRLSPAEARLVHTDTYGATTTTVCAKG